MGSTTITPTPLRPQVLPKPIQQTNYLTLTPRVQPTEYVPSHPLASAPTPETQVPPSPPMQVLNLHGEMTGGIINTVA